MTQEKFLIAKELTEKINSCLNFLISYKDYKEALYEPNKKRVPDTYSLYEFIKSKFGFLTNKLTNYNMSPNFPVSSTNFDTEFMDELAAVVEKYKEKYTEQLSSL